MIPHDILTLYAAKPVEYLIAVGFLLTFVPFWRFVQGGPAARAAALAARALPAKTEGPWFRLPARFLFHPGHSWLRVEAGGLVALGMDEFAHRLVGPVAGVRLPAVGTKVTQGDVGWSLLADAKAVDMLSPVDGEVVEVNASVLQSGHRPAEAYGDGWLLRVRPSRLSASLNNLLYGTLARRWMEETEKALWAIQSSPELGPISADGGTMVDGLARSIDPEHWDELAREFFLTDTHALQRNGLCDPEQ